MARIIGIDFGEQRSGIAVTDPLQLIVSPLTTVNTKSLFTFLTDYIKREDIEKIVFGLPLHKDGNPTYLMPFIRKLCVKINEQFPEIVIDYQDECFSTNKAKNILFKAGVKKLKRKNKEIIDRISAVIILQEYLGHI